MPSTVSSVVSRPFASSTVITPSLPTFSIASAIFSPMSSSPFAEIAATCLISFRPDDGIESFLSSCTTVSTAFSIPRFNAIGFAPAVTDFRPSREIACASTVAVVVPSPARSEVLVATSFTICAPMFSISSSSSLSFATVTPSLVTVGLPNFLSMTTFRPLGPSVTFTASANCSTPRFSRASVWVRNSKNLAAMSVLPPEECLRELRDDVGFFDQDDLFVVQLDLRAAVLPVDHAIPNLQLHRDRLALLPPPRSNGDDFALDRLFFGGIRDVQSTLHRLRLLHRPDRDAIGQRVDFVLLARLGCCCHDAQSLRNSLN